MNICVQQTLKSRSPEKKGLSICTIYKRHLIQLQSPGPSFLGFIALLVTPSGERPAFPSPHCMHTLVLIHLIHNKTPPWSLTLYGFLGPRPSLLRIPPTAEQALLAPNHIGLFLLLVSSTTTEALQ